MYARCHCSSLLTSEVDLWRAERTGEPSRRLSPEPWSWAGRIGWNLHGALVGYGGWRPGHTEGWWSICTARSRISAGTACIHAGRCRAAAAAHTLAGDGQIAGRKKPNGRSRSRLGDHRKREQGEPRSWSHRLEFGVCDLYLRIDREAERSGSRTSRSHQAIVRRGVCQV